jgi:hypothetical protein
MIAIFLTLLASRYIGPTWTFRIIACAIVLHMLPYVVTLVFIYLLLLWIGNDK